jgi:hypothetical protein
MNPMYSYWAVVERMQSLRAEADAAARHAAPRARHAAARARQPSRSRRGLALVAGLGRGRPGTTARGIAIRAGEAL